VSFVPGDPCAPEPPPVLGAALAADSLDRLAALRHVAPAAHLLLARYLEAAGLSGAVMTAQNCASGAVAALAEGKAGASAALAGIGS